MSIEELLELEWKHRQMEIALNKKLPPSEELVKLRAEVKASEPTR